MHDFDRRVASHAARQHALVTSVQAAACESDGGRQGGRGAQQPRSTEAVDRGRHEPGTRGPGPARGVGPAYSARTASAGGRRLARAAGYRPARAPTTSDAATPPASPTSGMASRQPRTSA